MSKRFLVTLTAVALTALALAAPAGADFGFEDTDVAIVDEDGSPALQAGSHPYALTTTIDFNVDGAGQPEGSLKDLITDLPPGLVGDPYALPRCSTADFLTINIDKDSIALPACAQASILGVIGIRSPGEVLPSDVAPVYNLLPPPGAAAKIGMRVLKSFATITFGVRPDGSIYANLANSPQIEPLVGAVLTVWGTPAATAHDGERGICLYTANSCPTNLTPRPFLTLPTRCEGPLLTSFAMAPWQNPGVFVTDVAESHDNSIPPQPLGTSGCDRLSFNPTIGARPTTLAAQSPTGLDFSLEVKDEGIRNPAKGALAASQIKKAVVTLPEGMSVNPSIAAGLNVCTPAQLARETADSPPGAGCPDASKIGSLEIETPLLEGKLIKGSLFQAPQDDPATSQPGAENPFDTLIALYMVIKDPELGVLITQPLEVEPDPLTGRLTTVAENLPQVPFSHFRLHFREGTRSPLVSPPHCGTFAAEATLTPWSGAPPITTSSAFQIISGPNGGPCPSGATPPFKPGLEAGTLNNAAGHYSPFHLRLDRNDGEQEFTNFSIKLPPGLIGKLAGIPYCPDTAIAAAKTRTAAAELASPSCPLASEIGHTLVGAGVGPSLAYASGKIYLAGPYHGSPLSAVAITAAKVGPFELGTVVVRDALKIDPETAEVFADATGSDPIPHILKGIPVHARDVRVYVDRPDFILNPTNCTPTSTASTVLGSGLDFGSSADDQPVTVTTPFQAADCASLGFKPKLALKLKGGTGRGQNPAFRALLTFPKTKGANIARAQVTLPHSAFLDQSHIKTICTRVQFAQGAHPGEKCPQGSIYGYAKAITPLLDDPVAGPVFLRSSSHPLPDLVAALHSGQIDFNLVGRIDSVKNGRIRNTFESAPDAPVTSFLLQMQGGKKGLLVNSIDLCRSTNRAIADFTGQNGRKHVFEPVLQPRCGKGKGGGEGDEEVLAVRPGGVVPPGPLRRRRGGAAAVLGQMPDRLGGGSVLYPPGRRGRPEPSRLSLRGRPGECADRRVHSLGRIRQGLGLGRGCERSRR